MEVAALRPWFWSSPLLAGGPFATKLFIIGTPRLVETRPGEEHALNQVVARPQLDLVWCEQPPTSASFCLSLWAELPV
jgi:hypothetical protein